MSPNPAPFDVHAVYEVALPVAATSSLESSNSSIGTGSPASLIPEPLLHDARASLGSSHGTPTVKFAPLPQIDPNRKRSLAPLGVPAHLRRKQVIQQEGRSLLWSADPEVAAENMEDPIITFAKFVKKTGATLWRRVRKGSKAVPHDVAYSTEPVLDIGSAVGQDDMAPGERGEHVLVVVGGEDKRGHRVSWSPLGERRTLGRDKVQRRSTAHL